MTRAPYVRVLGEYIRQTRRRFVSLKVGPLRVRDTPISEAATSSRRMGAAMTWPDIAEIHVSPTSSPCASTSRHEFPRALHDEIAGEGPPSCAPSMAAAPALARSIRQSSELCMMLPVLKACASSRPMGIDCCAARARSDPVIFLEHSRSTTKGQCRRRDVRHALAPPRSCSGQDATILALALLGAARSPRREAQDEQASTRGDRPSPLLRADTQTILVFCGRAHIALFTVEESARCARGSDWSRSFADEAFYDLDGPPVRITTPHIPLPAADILEDLLCRASTASPRRVQRSLQ